MTSHCITWHDTTQAITSHQMTWPSHDLTPEQTPRHQNTSLQSTKHHHHGRAEGSFTAKKCFGHRAGRSPCVHSIGKFFLCYIVLFLLETSAPGLSGHYWYIYRSWEGMWMTLHDRVEKTCSPNEKQSVRGNILGYGTVCVPVSAEDTSSRSCGTWNAHHLEALDVLCTHQIFAHRTKP